MTASIYKQKISGGVGSLLLIPYTSAHFRSMAFKVANGIGGIPGELFTPVHFSCPIAEIGCNTKPQLPSLTIVDVP